MTTDKRVIENMEELNKIMKDILKELRTMNESLNAVITSSLLKQQQQEQEGE